MQNHRPFEAYPIQAYHVVPIVQHTRARRLVPGVPILLQVLGVGHADVVAEQVEGFLQHVPHASQLSRLEQVGPVDDDLQVRRRYLVEQASRLYRRVDHVVHLRLEHVSHPHVLGDSRRCRHGPYRLRPGF